MRPPPIRWSTSTHTRRTQASLWTQASTHWMEAVPSRASTFAPCAFGFSPCGNEANTNGMGLSTQSPAPPHGPVHAATTRGQTRALTPHASAALNGLPANRSVDGIEKSQHLLAEASCHWESCVDASRACGPWPQTSRNPRSPRNTARGPQSQPATRPSPHLWRGRRFRRPLRLRACGQLDSETRVLRRPQRPLDSPSRRTPTLPALPATHHGPATCVCDATAVSKGFRRLRAGHDGVSRKNHDTSAAIRAPA